MALVLGCTEVFVDGINTPILRRHPSVSTMLFSLLLKRPDYPK